MKEIEKELMGHCTWDELSDNEIFFYVLQEKDPDLDKEYFGNPRHIIERFERS